MECICPYCGQKGPSSNLCFDFSEQFKRWKGAYFAGCAREDVERFGRAFDGLVNAWSNQGYGPTFLSESELLANTEDLASTGARDVFQGILAIPTAMWKKKLKAWRDRIPAEYRDLLEFMMGDSFARREHVLRLEVQYYREGEGDVYITAVRDTHGNVIADQRHCPHCGGVMSYWAGRYPEVVLTVLGGPRISKSTALAACADVFVNGGAACAVSWKSYGARTEDSDGVQENGDKSWNRFEDDCLAPYSANRRVEATRTGSPEAIPRFSVLVQVGRSTKLILTVVDLPGEYSRGRNRLGVSDAIFREYQNFYRNVDCVWYCTDELELRQISIRDEDKADQAKYGYSGGRQATPTGELVARMSQLSSLFRKDVPVVFLLGKSDTVETSGPLGPILYREDYRPGAPSDWLDVEGKRTPVLRAKDFCDRAHRLRTYLAEQNEALIQAFEENFPVHTFLATSNYGHGFLEDGTPAGPRRPFQTDAPFLWMLAMLGYLPTGEGDREYYAADPAGRGEEDRLTWENLGMYGRSANGYRSHHSRRSGVLGLFGGR